MDTIHARVILLLALATAPACAQRVHRIDVMPSPSGVPGSIRLYELLSNCSTPNDLSTCQYADIQTDAALAGTKQYKFGTNLETAGALYFLSGIAAPQINADGLGSVLTIRGSSTGSGNINLQPGNVAGLSSVVFQSARLDAPVFITKDAAGTTTSDSWQAQKDDGTVFARLLGGTNASLPGAFLAGGFFCQTANSCQQGTSGNRFTKIWTTDIDISGSCTGAGCPSAGFPVSDAISLVEDNVDGTKEMRFELGSFTTGTVRVLTPQNADYMIAGTNLVQAFTAVQSFAADINMQSDVIPNVSDTESIGLPNRYFSEMNARVFSAQPSSGDTFKATFRINEKAGSAGNEFVDIVTDDDLSSSVVYTLGTNLIAPGGIYPLTDAATSSQSLGHSTARWNAHLYSATIHNSLSSASVIPLANATYNLGAPGLAWNTLRLSSGIIIAGLTGVTQTIQFTTATGTCTVAFTGGVVSSTSGNCP